MGMFDTIHIHDKFLPKIKELEINKYCIKSLQTKNFDNLLENYHVGEDGVLFLDKVDYELVENQNASKGGWNPPFFQEEKSREKIQFPYTGIVTAGMFFMDYTDNPKDEIFVDINFKFVDGVLQEVGKIKTLKVTPSQEVLERRQKIKEIKLKIENDIKYHIFKYISKFLTKIIISLNKINNYLVTYKPE